MSWLPDLYTGEMRPWPESVTVKRGNESKAYVPLGETLATYDGERDILFVVSEYAPHVRVVPVVRREVRGGGVMSEKHYPYYGGSFDRIIFDKDGSVWIPESENVKLQAENAKLRDAMYTNAGKHALQHMDEDELRIWATQQSEYIEELREFCTDLFDRLRDKDEHCGECRSQCEHDAWNFGDQKCVYAKRMRELGIEVSK